jgi:Kyakuja-Dileera-Zisupton transposase
MYMTGRMQKQESHTMLALMTASSWMTGELRAPHAFSALSYWALQNMQLLFRLAQDTLAYLESLNVKGGHKYCGGSAWRKGTDSKGKYAGLCISGRVFAGCNHMIVSKAINMLGTGEKYAYIYLMFKKYFAKRGVRTVFGDVMCKWHPWLVSTVEKLVDHPVPNNAEVPILTKEELDQHQPVVAGVHAKAHSWNCQVSMPACFHSFRRWCECGVNVVYSLGYKWPCASGWHWYREWRVHGAHQCLPLSIRQHNKAHGSST